MKHYWINIDKSIDRRSFMEEQFKNNKLDNERISAITPRDFDEVLEDKRPLTCKHPGCVRCEYEYACISSHIKAIIEGLNNTANEVDTPKEILEQIKLLKEYATSTMNVMNKPADDELTLEYVLNMFDGIVEQHDAIIVFTTNHLEDIDPAVIRPGRVDYILELKNATVETIKEMIQTKYKLSDEEMLKYDELLESLRSKEISPALVQNKCFTYTREGIEEMLKELVLDKRMF